MKQRPISSGRGMPKGIHFPERQGRLVILFLYVFLQGRGSFVRRPALFRSRSRRSHCFRPDASALSDRRRQSVCFCHRRRLLTFAGVARCRNCLAVPARKGSRRRTLFCDPGCKVGLVAPLVTPALRLVPPARHIWALRVEPLHDYETRDGPDFHPAFPFCSASAAHHNQPRPRQFVPRPLMATGSLFRVWHVVKRVFSASAGRMFFKWSRQNDDS